MTSAVRRRWLVAGAVGLAALGVGVGVLVARDPEPAVRPEVPPAEPCSRGAGDTVDGLLDCVALAGVVEHLEALQAIADEHGGTRADGTPGYEASADYVAERAEAAGLRVSRVPFDVSGSHWDDDEDSEGRSSQNVVAELRGLTDDNVVVVGAHLDSVEDGPGINDNGTGVAAVLEVAESMAGTAPANTVRFVWWGAEEVGLTGSDEYVDSLSREERDRIALYLNFDMVGSPNGVRFVHDGDGSSGEGAAPRGSAAIEEVFRQYFTDRGLEVEELELDDGSDFVAFAEAGIPVGGVLTGDSGEKTAEQAAVYGGEAGEQYDPCYHQDCDTIENVNLELLEQNADAVAYATWTFAQSTEAVDGVAGGPVAGG
ncbi:MAG TPA: M28 family metallopeptidase [Geodermatophilus sp.]|nr:M28 family metallopeptidase [Geodermatophilus sp.]